MNNTTKPTTTPNSSLLNQAIIQVLEDSKALDIQQLDVRDLTDVMDSIIVASGTSSRHVKSLAQNAMLDLKSQGYTALGIEGLDTGDWVLVDFGDIVLHVMQTQTREFYDLERLWTVGKERADVK